MRIKRLLALFAVLIFAVGAFAPVGAQGNNAVVLYPQELDNLNPMYSSMFFMGITTDLYLAPAWNFDDALEPNPVLVAEVPSVENGGLSEDGRTITLTLREGLTWSDGEPLTSADFLFTYQMFSDPANTPNTTYPYGEADGIIESVEAPDETTVVVNFVEPFAPWVATLFTAGILPEHILGPEFEANGTLIDAAWNRAPTVGSGPFVFAEWEIGSFMRFVRNDNYFGNAPSLDQVILRFIPESDVLLATLLNNEGDLATFIPFSDVPALEAAGLEAQVVPSGFNEQWVLNIREGLAHPAMLDVRVREALALATDREAFTENALLGYTYPAPGYWEGSPFASPDVSAPPFDPERAAELLDEAGWVDESGNGIREQDGVELVLRYVTNVRGIRQDAQAVFQQQLADVGIGVELITYPSDVFFNGFAEGGPVAIGDYDIAQFSQSPSFPDPNTTVFRCGQIPTEDSPDGNNYRGYCNEAVEELFAQSERETDFDARVAIFHQIDELIAADFVFVGIWYDADTWIVSERLDNVAISGATPFWNVADWVAN
ncbi:MAG: peptide ABC transporter substrate-binding protein [Anaerolineaceae bacterium]|nr:MAG: peptide ABC transporter substrate-binding protein [Anaerolineaceae bacterium]